MPGTPYLEQVEEPFFVEELDRLREHYPNIYDVKDSVSWDLARKPDAGIVMPGVPPVVRLFITYPIGSAPSFLILYHIDETKDPKLHFLSIQPIVEEEEWQ